MIDDLEASGVRSMILIASPMGRPIYEREGFRVLEQQVRSTIDGLSPAENAARPAAPSVRPERPEDACRPRPIRHGRRPEPGHSGARRPDDDDRRPRPTRRDPGLPDPGAVARRRGHRPGSGRRAAAPGATPPRDGPQRQGGRWDPREQRRRAGAAPRRWLARGARRRPDDPRRAARLAAGRDLRPIQRRTWVVALVNGCRAWDAIATAPAASALTHPQVRSLAVLPAAATLTHPSATNAVAVGLGPYAVLSGTRQKDAPIWTRIGSELAVRD